MAILPLEADTRRRRSGLTAVRGADTRPTPRRAALLSVHTSPLDQPGSSKALASPAPSIANTMPSGAPSRCFT